MFKKFIQNKAKGTIAVEWVICCPFALIITFFSIMILIFTLDYHLISKNTAQLVSYLNMGDKGYTKYSSYGASKSDVIPTGIYASNDMYIPKKVKGTSVKCNITKDNNSYFYNSAKYFINLINENGGFTPPYCQLTDLNCKVYRNFPNHEAIDFSTAKGATESGDIIVVETRFVFCGLIPVEIQSFGFIN